MAEVTYRSPGVYTNEIDLTGPTTAQPVGTPAGVIGTSNEGPAFVPITVGSYSDFAAVFGATDGQKFGPLAVQQFLKHAQALTYVRVLGIGDGKQRSSDTGVVTNAGFVVGSKQVQANGLVGRNVNAVDGGDPGRTMFLGVFMSGSAGSPIFSDSGLQTADSNANIAVPIIRGVLMAPSGVIIQLSGNWTAGSTQPRAGIPARTTDNGTLGVGGRYLQGAYSGSCEIGSQQFTLLLNGHIHNSAAPNVITASFDMEDASYFSNVLNTDPFKIEEKGHLLYAAYDIHPALAVVTGANVLTGSLRGRSWDKGALGGGEPIAFLASGTLDRDAGDANSPNYESWEERFTHPKSPFVVSQDFGGKKWNIVRIHALGDGDYSNTHIKISIENLKPSTSTTDKYGTFDLLVRQWTDTDFEKKVVESFRGLSLDPSSDKFIARAIGDMYSYFDFDQASSSQKLVVAGDHPVKSNYIRVEQSNELRNGQVPKEALPFGYRGYTHLVTSGTNPLAAANSGGSLWPAATTQTLRKAVQPPVPYRQTIAVGTSPNDRPSANLYWGTQFMQKMSIAKPNLLGLQDRSIAQFTKFFPQYGSSNRDVVVGNNPGVADSAGTVLDCDKFNNNIFSLERVMVRTGSDTNADPEYWVTASYIRNGGAQLNANPSNKTRALNVNDMKIQGNRKFGKFTFFLQSGFNGLNIFNKDKSRLLNAAAKREMDDSTAQGGVSGPTIAAYRKALDIMGTKSDVDIKLLAIPGLRTAGVTNYAIDTVENRFDAMYVMDIEEQDEMASVITSSAASTANIGTTVAGFRGRALDTSFAAAYFPDVVLTDPTTFTNVQCPPSVAVMGAFSLNDAIGYPWFAPAGFSRGALTDVLQSSVPLNKSNMDDLYDADINPLTAFPGTGVMVFGQKTLMAAPSALDRVNVRRLLINVRRKVRAVANQMLFEPNRQETLDKFSSLVQPILQSIQEKSGVERFKVVIDATTTTQTDVENNTLRGKIFLQPTRTAEFVSLDFVLTNAGDAFDNA